MTVVVSKREVGLCRHEFDIEAPAEEVDAEHLRVALDYRARARLDGFRKGKAPLDLIRQRFAEAIGEDVSERLAPKYWQLAREEEDVQSMLPPSVGPVEVVPGQPLRFTVTVDVEPDVDIDEDRASNCRSPKSSRPRRRSTRCWSRFAWSARPGCRSTDRPHEGTGCAEAPSLRDARV